MTSSLGQHLAPLAALTLTLASPSFAQHAPFAEHARSLDLPTHADHYTTRSSPTHRGPATRPCTTVFGFLPYWVSDANVRYDLLTHVATFSVEVNANGTLGNDHGWPWTATISRARQDGCKVLITATLFSPTDLLALLSNSSRRATFINAIRNKILEGPGADGVVIDFEGDPTNGWPAYMHGFLAELTIHLHSTIPGSCIVVATPAVNWSGRWNLPAVADACDLTFIMGYAFYGSFSSSSGPTAPLTGGTYNITNTIDVQYAGVRRDKLILGVPYYGNHWSTQTASARSTAVDWVQSITFAQERSALYGRLWDPASQTPWYNWHNGVTWQQVWYDDAQSLGLKLDLAQLRNLGGAGMWALGYDGGRQELWNLITTRYVDACPAPCDADTTADGIVDVFDLLAFLDDWFADDADFDTNGITDVFDLLAYLNDWFAGC